MGGPGCRDELSSLSVLELPAYQVHHPVTIDERHGPCRNFCFRVLVHRQVFQVALAPIFVKVSLCVRANIVESVPLFKTFSSSHAIKIVLPSTFI